MDLVVIMVIMVLMIDIVMMVIMVVVDLMILEDVMVVVVMVVMDLVSCCSYGSYGCCGWLSVICWSVGCWLLVVVSDEVGVRVNVHNTQCPCNASATHLLHRLACKERPGCVGPYVPSLQPIPNRFHLLPRADLLKSQNSKPKKNEKSKTTDAQRENTPGDETKCFGIHQKNKNGFALRGEIRAG